MLLATTIEGYDAELVERVVPLVDMIEISPDRWVREQDGVASIPRSALDFIAGLARQAPLVVHGVGLSIGSYDHWSQAYIGLLDQLFEAVPIRWHSEHLGYAEVEGEPLGTMVELPRSREALRLVSQRVRAIQRRYGVPFLLENVARALPDDGTEQFSPAGFVNEIVADTGCGLLLDVYNLECDRHNIGLNIADFLDELDLRAVREIHIAGGTLYKGFRLDIHSRLVEDSTIALAREAMSRCPAAEVVVFEILDEAVAALGARAVAAELVRLRGRLGLV
jgi:uncharacterized protein (UPF0276 family)